ncbi:MAG: DUF4143 domain-containing protein [Proteobacteria bacterium]|nr:DUF4143 domain-containing protein [Pseudomonadota bacterium]
MTRSSAQIILPQVDRIVDPPGSEMIKPFARFSTLVKYAHLSRHDQNRDIKDVLKLLTMAGVILPIYHSDCSGIPLAAGEDTAALKLLFLDEGLACRALGLDWSEQLHLEYVRLINDGALAEQFVGHELAAVGSPREAAHLHFWRRDKAQSEA